jgi:chromosome segregation ATPase
MQSFSVTATSVLALAVMNSARALDAKSEADPLGKVLDLMGELSAKVKKEGEAEAAAFKEYFAWCDDVSKNKNFAIKTASAQKEKLEAKIEELSANIEKADSDISTLADDIATADADLKSATSIRAKESEDFVTGEKELNEVVDTLGRANTILQREMQKNPAALAQMSSNSLSSVISALNVVVDAAAFSATDKQRLTSLVQSQQETEEDLLGAPAADNYKSHSSSILEVIADMQDKAEAQLSDLRKAETSARHAYEMLKQSLDDQLTYDNKNLDEAKADKAAAEESKSAAEGDLAVTVADLKAAQEALEKANASCMQVANDHDETERARNAELKAIAEATKILQSTTSGAVSRTYSMIQVSSNSRVDLAKSEVVVFVKKLAKTSHSAALAQLASRINALVHYGSASRDGPFDKVKGLIQDMIAKLEAEAVAEASEKAFCDEEMAKTAAKKEELDNAIEKLTTKIDQTAARSAELKSDVKKLQEELAAMAAEQAEADKVRQDTHAAYAEAKPELEEGLEGVRRALEVLRTYYAMAGDALLQQPEPPLPAKHTAASGAGNSIIGILEVCESDFAMNLAKEETAESEAQEAYEEMTQENKVNTAANTQDVKYKTKEYTSLDKSLAELSSDRANLNTQLDAVLEYDEKIKDRCIAKPETYEARKQRREAEIAGLKEALEILENEAAFVQRAGKHRRGHNMRGGRLSSGMSL